MLIVPARLPSGRRMRTANGIAPFRVKCLNLTPQYLYVSGVQQGTAEMWTQFNWVGWLKPQIDLAVANGFNAVKLICMGPGIVEASPSRSGQYGGTYPSAATLYNSFKAFLDYCRQQGLGVVINLMQGGDWVFNKTTTQQMLQAAQMVCSWCESILNSPVIEIDICNECDGYRPSTWGANTAASQAAMVADLSTLFAMCRAVTSIPLSASFIVQDPTWWMSSLSLALAPLVDLHDVHFYGGSNPLLSDAATFFASPSYKGAWWVGEYGGLSGNSTAFMQSRIASIAALEAHPQCFGANYWNAAQYPNAGGSGNGLSVFSLTDQNVANPNTTLLAALTAEPAY